MSAPLARRVILLCDASESADALVAAGARLYLVESSATSVAQTVARIGHNDVDGLEADPSDPTALDRAVSRATKRFGTVNAAV
ncbi:MAG: SDR family oxidoreductase, partial [Tepidiformaceae bacterium]